MHRGLLLAVLLAACSPAAAQSTQALGRVTQALGVCRASVMADPSSRQGVWTAAEAAGFTRSTPDQPLEWTDGTVTVGVAPAVLGGVPGCHVAVRGQGARPTALVSVVGAWARGEGFAAAPGARLLLSMQSQDLYLDGRSLEDGLVLELGWRDD